MATADIQSEMELSEEIFDLETVKRLTRENNFCGFDKFEIPIYQWRVLEFWGLDKNIAMGLECGKNSETFPIKTFDHVGVLSMNEDYNYGPVEWALSLILFRTNKNEEKKELNSVPYFICKRMYFQEEALVSQEFYFTAEVFDPNKDSQTLFFRGAENIEVVGKTVIELYQEPFAKDEYASPYKNMAVGRIEHFKAESKGLHLQQLSPRFSLESADLQMVLKFWNANLKEKELAEKGLSATLHVLNHNKDREPGFSFFATITIFSQKESKKNLVKNILLKYNEMKYPIFLAFFSELDKLLDPEDDTLYYKIVVKAANGAFF